MNILLINHYAGSPEMGMEFRPYYFAREWIKKGHRVDIMAASYSHIRRVNPDVTKDFQTDIIDGIRYHWIKTLSYKKNGIKRMLTMAQFVGKLLIYADKIVKELKPNVVICSSTYPLDTYAGQRIKKLSAQKVKLIHEVHDMWPISPIEIGGMSPRHPFIKIMQMGEDSFCHSADAVVSLLPAAKEYFIEHGMAPEKFHHIPNGVVPEEWEQYQNIPKKLADYLTNNSKLGKFNLCFLGTIQKTYNLEILISAVKKTARKDLAVTFIGPGMDKDELKILTSGCEDTFRFFDPIPKKSVPDLFNYIDAVFIGVKSSKICRFGICMNKLFDSMMGGKPILYMAEAPNNYIERYRCGVTVCGQDETALIQALDKLLKKDKLERYRMGTNGRNAVTAEFNYPKLAEKFLTVMGQ